MDTSEVKPGVPVSGLPSSPLLQLKDHAKPLCPVLETPPEQSVLNAPLPSSRSHSAAGDRDQGNLAQATEGLRRFLSWSQEPGEAPTIGLQLLYRPWRAGQDGPPEPAPLRPCGSQDCEVQVSSSVTVHCPLLLSPPPSPGALYLPHTLPVCLSCLCPSHYPSV